jgi:hypothetical protein
LAGLHPVYISYEESVELIPVFEHLAEHAPWRSLRDDSKIILRSLRDVRPIDYPLGGMQVLLPEKLADLLKSAQADLGK